MPPRMIVDRNPREGKGAKWKSESVPVPGHWGDDPALSPTPGKRVSPV